MRGCYWIGQRILVPMRADAFESLGSLSDFAAKQAERK